MIGGDGARLMGVGAIFYRVCKYCDVTFRVELSVGIVKFKVPCLLVLFVSMEIFLRDQCKQFQLAYQGVCNLHGATKTKYTQMLFAL